MKKILGALLVLVLTLSTPVTAFAKTENNKVANTKPINVMDVQYGVSRESTRLFMESGTIPYTPYSGHQYSLTIYGYAYTLEKPCVDIYAKIFWMN